MSLGHLTATITCHLWAAQARDCLSQQVDQEVAREVGEEKWKRYKLVSWAFDEIMRLARSG